VQGDRSGQSYRAIALEVLEVLQPGFSQCGHSGVGAKTGQGSFQAEQSEQPHRVVDHCQAACALVEQLR
jgi:hypothetical protein